ncbi:hypothetical protein [Serratia bockelmannii]|uniref:MrpH family fimbial adhesin n=1 Tax=Serratia bockelmannii TaxID=2703793 RepID=UPI0011F32B6C|nr:hypothetical protein [Serratia bockelmannii]MBH3084209.1 hypothetical protein [Serratia marcescens]
MKSIMVCLIGVFFLYSSQATAGWALDIKYAPNDAGYFLATPTQLDVNDPTPSPLSGCYDDRSCGVAILYYGGLTGKGWFGEFPLDRRKASATRTVGELSQLLIDSGYLNKTFKSQTGLYSGTRYCFALMSIFSTYIIPGGDTECTLPEIIPNYCSIAEPYIELNHGSLSANAVSGHTIRKQLRVSCNQPYKAVIIAADQSGLLSLGNGLTSQLKVNGVDLGKGYMATFGPTASIVELSSTLSGSPGSYGTFQGSKVIILSLP